MRNARHGLAVAATVLLLLGVSGCTAYPDGVVARRHDGLYARSHCPTGSMAQVVSAEVYVNSRLVWAAHAKGEAVDEIPLLRNAEDTVVTFDDAQALAENDSVGVAITTVQSTWGGAEFSLAKLPDGHVADANGTIVAEDRLGRPNLLSGVDCGGPIPGLSMYTTVLIAVLVSIGMLVVTVLVTRRLKR